MKVFVLIERRADYSRYKPILSKMKEDSFFEIYLVVTGICLLDLHGKDIWKKINPDNFDKIIFLGDYMDASYKTRPEGMKFSDLLEIIIDEERGKTDEEIISNLLDIIELKKIIQKK